jgi:hypothetical protein
MRMVTSGLRLKPDPRKPIPEICKETESNCRSTATLALRRGQRRVPTGLDAVNYILSKSKKRRLS